MKRTATQLFRFIFIAGIFNLCLIAPASAQQNNQKLKTTEKRIQKDQKVKTYELNKERGSIQSISFKTDASYPASETDNLIHSYFNLRDGIDSYQPKNTTIVDGSISVNRYQQYFKGVIVEYGNIVVTNNNGFISYINAEHYTIAENTTTVPVLTESQALGKALEATLADKYMWEEAGIDSFSKVGGYPKGVLVFINDFYNNTGVSLAYKFDIYATRPLSRNHVYINAIDGAVLFKNAILKHTNSVGTAATRYSGTKNITTDYTGSNYRLKETVPTMMGIETVNMHKTSNYNQAIDFTDADNNWTALEYSNANFDDALLDAHWGAEQVYSYWKNIQGRNSYDNGGAKIKSYVHYGVNYNNAYWNGDFMTYGDGSPAGFKALTSLDICGHELGHGICQYTADLIYQKESGALNEAFSDIWAACIEHNVDPANSFYETFLIGEQITNGWVKNVNRNALRDMKNPPAQGDPDTYGGINWISVSPCTPSSGNDYCGVHQNSGVLNKWFYILTIGEAGTNDLTNAYNVAGVGFSKSEKIAYLTEVSLTSTSTYANARTAAINAAITLYGSCSPEVIATTNAWYAVGVGALYSDVCSPVVHFISNTATVSESNGATTCHPSKTIITTIRIDGNPVQNATINLIPTGTAIQGQDYELSPASFTFTPGSGNSQDITITIYDDAVIEGNETLNIAYSISNVAGGSAIAGSANQTYSLTISDDDAAPNFGTTVVTTDTLLNQNFGTSGGTLPAGWTASTAGTNKWVVGSNGIAGTGQSAYITNNTTTKPLAYTSNSAADAYLRTPAINAANTSGMTLSFRYVCNGQQDNIAYYDFGVIEYSINGSAYRYVPDILQNVTTATTYSISLPDSLFANKTFSFSFRWLNNTATANNPPFNIDDVLITGTKTIYKTAVESQSGGSKSEYVPDASTVNIYSVQDRQMLASVSGANTAIGCVDVSLTGTGNGQTTMSTQSGSYNRTQKVFQISPAIANTTTNYQLTLYFTPAELAAWGGNNLNLKFLKVKDGTDLSGIIPSADFVVVNPSSVNDQTANGYIAYTGNFTGFSQFMLGLSVTPLPVQFLYLKAVPGNNLIHLDWATASENNNKGFYIERSTDGIHFNAISWMDGKSNSKSQQSYHYEDKEIISGVLYYYRIRQVDFNQQETFSEIRTSILQANGRGQFIIAPNPASHTIRLSWSNNPGKGEIRILNMQGAVVRTFDVLTLETPMDIDIKNLPAGVYTILVKTDADNLTKKFIKE